jgi:Na+/glutamate symporter
MIREILIFAFKAFFVAPVVGSLLVNFFASPVIAAFINMLRALFLP